MMAFNFSNQVKSRVLTGLTRRTMTFYTHPTQPLTSVFHREPLVPQIAGSTDKQLLVFIPGNPGLIDYYTTYLEIIQKKYPTLELFNISHAGFQTTDNYIELGEGTPFEFYNLEFQINHKVEVLREFLSDRKEKTQLFFLCHSVGAYISQRVVQSILADPELAAKVEVRFVGLICPTILDIHKSSSGVFLCRLLWLLPLVRVVLLLTSFLKLILSESTLKRIVHYKLNTKALRQENNPDAQDNMHNSVIATYNLVLSQRIIKQALTLAEEEMVEITQDDDTNDFFFKELPSKGYGVKIWSFFADLDYWVHDTSRDAILAKYHDPENKNLLFEIGHVGGITHSFCVDQNTEFAAITCAALEKLFLNGL